MKTKIQPFKPTLSNVLFMEGVLRQAVRNSYKNRNIGWLPTFKKWSRDDARQAVKAYRMIKATEVPHVD